ncbi:MULTISPECIES: hypothetical protein [unclassified Streptomyces]|uniref:hypothetical protein n=1 Tax=unclassified Streptomyces TaxID=2593676 RepID=UPI002E129D35|nr:hypothetical protein OG533_07830 [Streptomyces sp. NBC_01186]WSS40538.1 hypothetical protein OG220_07980 [Streptomyces sp. NBC_01187]
MPGAPKGCGELRAQPKTPALCTAQPGAAPAQHQERGQLKDPPDTCADLLDEFESAVESRADWVTAHRDTIDKALKRGIADVDLDRLIQETADTTTQLDTARENLKRLIQERYPMGSADAGSG